MTTLDGLRPRGWKEAAAGIGVILSLIFVGVELRQNTAAVSSTALNDLAAGINEWNLQVAGDGELADIYARWRDGTGEFSPAEEVRIRLLSSPCSGTRKTPFSRPDWESSTRWPCEDTDLAMLGLFRVRRLHRSGPNSRAVSIQISWRLSKRHTGFDGQGKSDSSFAA